MFGGNPNKEQELYQLGEQRIDQAAKDSGLTQRAEDNTKAMLIQLLRSLGYTTITVNVADTPAWRWLCVEESTTFCDWAERSRSSTLGGVPMAGGVAVNVVEC